MQLVKVPNFVLASKNQRMLHFIFDNFIIRILIIVIVQIIDISFSPDQFSPVNFLKNCTSIEFMVVTAPLYFLYFLIGEYFFGQTIAKHCTKSKVVNYYGVEPTFYAILTRSFIRIIPFEFLTFLYDKVGWHDLHSEPMIVSIKKLNTYLVENQ